MARMGGAPATRLICGEGGTGSSHAIRLYRDDRGRPGEGGLTEKRDCGLIHRNYEGLIYKMSNGRTKLRNPCVLYY
jgi:hypothetical protein